MDKRILLTLALGAMSQVFTHAWEPKGDKIKTVWAEQVTPENVWQSYPRPQLQRTEMIQSQTGPRFPLQRKHSSEACSDPLRHTSTIRSD